MAASICERSKPMASMLAMASARCWPMAKAFGSLDDASGAAARFGVGVEGAAAAVPEDCAGAAGAAGVDACAEAGVAGTAEEEDAAGAAAGAGLGWEKKTTLAVTTTLGQWLFCRTYLVYDTDNKALLLNLVGLNGVLILENLACKKPE